MVVGHVPVAVLALLTAAGCGGDDESSSDAVAATSGASESSTTTAAETSEILGSWHRAQGCEEMLVAFEKAGLAESHRDWLQGNFYGGKPGPKKGDPCAGAQGPLEHDHYFTADGGFGSHDQNGEEVDGGDFEEIDADTVTFPSHAEEFGYQGDILVDYTVNEGVVTFAVDLPNACADTCADAYAWALSAFASGPWQQGEVPG
ncbi:hypothetical protein EKO23_22745 [Nocardioides guangzhouensis]|uniref:Lipoprotein n=1 Tax=Nocardioides guangzhouensis TaxID=2497878 RepID=A0A4Q4Z4V2_9ACTN|nr:hypothetical protein [Nocardioides guangzhouensis]RYP81996.1 hypothetical protein EKO23_22745 [Nocardioides guangzhouensis]